MYVVLRWILFLLTFTHIAVIPLCSGKLYFLQAKLGDSLLDK